MTGDRSTIAEMLNARRDDLTRAERQLADAILGNYPVSGLGSITEIAGSADVSTPTVARMVQKLGFAGYPEFQAALRRELQDVVSNPIVKRETWVQTVSEEHVLNRYTQEVTDNIRRTLDQLDPASFDTICGLVADDARQISVTGGRITGVIATYLFSHLQMIRSRVTLIPSNTNAWPHYLLDMQAGDVLVVFDIRRYENSTLLLAELAHEKGAEIVLFTDQWRSPVQKYASHTIPARIAVPSAWDSSVATMLLVEALIAAVQEMRWDSVRGRTEELEASFDRTRLFRKFV